jgi:DNA (cytosine-5)-methyltransferase 1
MMLRPDYYNENDPYAAQWLRNLITAGLIPAGEVDERSIMDVSPADLAGFRQCHFFAGIGGWALAAQIAGWPAERSLWTASCPCQPFSTAGKRKHYADERHLWPVLLRLIAKCRPARFAGEQVANAVEWLRNMRSDLEALGYAVGAVPIEAASAGSQQWRDRFWVVARGQDCNDGSADNETSVRQESEFRGRFRPLHDGGPTIRLAGRLLPDAGFPLLAHAIPARLAKYRAFGNAIDPQLGAQVLTALMEAA